MNKTSSLNRCGTKLCMGFAALIFFTSCINGFAAPAQTTGNSKDQASATSDKDNQLVGPDYYQSSDNPYHSD